MREDDPAEVAAQQLSDLNTFAIVVSILEGGHVHSPSHDAADRIIKIALLEQQRCLRRYDAALARNVAGRQALSGAKP